MTPEDKKDKIAFHMGQILETLGLDLPQTPARVAKLYVEDLFSGLDPATYPCITLHEPPKTKELVLLKNIALRSICEHHLVPMMGMAHVAYLPHSGILGLSTIHRILYYFAKRPQLQESLTEECAEALCKELKTEDVAVMLQMKHLCVQDQGGVVETVVLRGAFDSETSLRSAFFNRIN